MAAATNKENEEKKTDVKPKKKTTKKMFRKPVTNILITKARNLSE